MIAVARSSFSSGACAATSALPRRTASSKARTSSSPKPRPETSARASSASPSTIEMCRRSRPASSSSFTTLRTTSASKTLATVVAIIHSLRYGYRLVRRASARRVVPGVGGVEALDDGLLAPERDPLLGVSGGGPPRDPDLLGDAQALLDHHHLLVEGDDGGLALLAHRDGGVDPAVERDALELDLLDGERRVDDLLGRADLGPDPHRAGDFAVLADDRPLLDHGHGHPLRGAPPRHSRLSSTRSGAWTTVRRCGRFRGIAAKIYHRTTALKANEHISLV